jgi:F-type H+-transporting ATPase subunit a
VENFPLIFDFKLLGIDFPITLAIVEQWVIILVIMMFVLLSTRKLETIPKGIQVWGELIVETINNVVKSIMGEKFTHFAPYIGTIMIYLLIMNLFGLTGFEPPTTDYSIALSLAIVSFVIIQVTAIKHNGFGHYLTAYAKPIWPLTPLNLIERFVVPVSLSLRLFGNMFAASILMGLIHSALEYASKLLHLGIFGNHVHFGLFQIVIPLFANAYFDVFDGAIQMVIFSMLTMIFIKTTTEH